MIPPEFAPHRTETQRIGDDIVTVVRNLRHDWPHMIRPGEGQAPGWASRSGASNTANRDNLDPDAPEHAVDQSYDSPDPDVRAKGASDSDMRRIDKTISLRRTIQDALNGWCRVVIEDRGTVGGIPSGVDVPGMCEFVQRHALWLGEHEAGQACLDELREFAHRAHLIVSPPRRETMSIGRCPLEIPGEQDVLEVCGGDVRARTGDEHLLDGKAWATCNRCGEVSPAEWWAERMFIDGESSPLVTIGELVAVIAYRLRVVVTHEQVRQWKHRGKIDSAGTDEKGRTLYRHEEVVDAIRADVRRKSAKVVG